MATTCAVLPAAAIEGVIGTRVLRASVAEGSGQEPRNGEAGFFQSQAALPTCVVSLWRK